ncbi:hypothetical protein AtubIFM54640_001014 [Aspergillus tubingensis]|nr:hypothetical protein AtubIFM54640_001014 [Aspergillus tubingensis]
MSTFLKMKPETVGLITRHMMERNIQILVETPLGQPGDFAKVTELCAVSRWFDEPRLFGLSDGYLKEFQYNESRTHIVGTPITTARSGLSSLSASIEQDRRNSPETIRLTYFPDDQDILGTYVWTQAEGWKPGPQIV